jgi:hypothetical protein
VCSATVSVLPSNVVRDQMQLINSEVIIIKYNECVSVVLPQISDIKSDIFCAAVYYYLWPVWMYNAAVHTTA